MIDTNCSVEKIVLKFADLVERVGRLKACGFDAANVPLAELGLLSVDDHFHFLLHNRIYIDKAKTDSVLDLVITKVKDEADVKERLKIAVTALNHLKTLAFLLDEKDPTHIVMVTSRISALYHMAFEEVIKCDPVAAIMSYLSLNDNDLAKKYAGKYDIEIDFNPEAS